MVQEVLKEDFNNQKKLKRKDNNLEMIMKKILELINKEIDQEEVMKEEVVVFTKIEEVIVEINNKCKRDTLVNYKRILMKDLRRN